MNTRLTQLCTVLAAATTGFCAGLLLAPHSGENTRRRIAVRARKQLRRAELKLDEVEQQMSELNDRLHSVSEEIGTRMRTAAQHTIDEHLPDLSAGADTWKLDEKEISRDLRHLSRG
jgi:gas vesicle protein